LQVSKIEASKYDGDKAGLEGQGQYEYEVVTDKHRADVL
jgi:hypothetical protein